MPPCAAPQPASAGLDGLEPPDPAHMDRIHRQVFDALERHPDDLHLWVLMCWTAPSSLAAASYRLALNQRHPELIPAIAGLDLFQPAWESAPPSPDADRSSAVPRGPSSRLPATRDEWLLNRASPGIFGMLLLFLLSLCAAEAVTAYLHPQAGMLMHGLLLLLVFPYSALALQGRDQKLMFTLTLAPLIRLVSLSMPLAGIQMIYWYLIIGTPLFLSAALAWQLTGFRRQDLGLARVQNLPLQLPVALSGLGLGYLEYQILKPPPLAPALTLDQFWLPALILLVFTGFLEELIFRGLMQSAAGPVLPRLGIVYISAIFAVLHIGYKSIPDLAFVFLVGLFFAWVVKRTGSLLGVALAHGFTNIALFLVVPYLNF